MNRMSFLAAAVFSVLALAAPAGTSAQTTAKEDATDEYLMQSAGFLAAHPDLDNRAKGWQAYNRGEFDSAMTYFRRAARYADKPSQGMVAEMYWKGEGVARDPVLAYVWMDLAAERLYEGFVILRERYWRDLDPDQQRAAVERGQAIYAEFGDTVARPRMAAVLRRARMNTTGSRTGMVGNLRIEIPGPGGVPQTIDGSKYYASKFWDPEEYQAWHDAVWMKTRTGVVNVGDVEPLRPADTQQDGADE